MPSISGHNANVELRGLDEVRQAVARLERAQRDPSIPFRVIGERMRRAQLQHFDDKEGPDGTPWPPLSEATIARRREGSGDAEVQTLRDTDVMYTSINYKADRRGVSVGTNDPKAEFHQFGTDNIPMRPFIYMTDDDADEYLSILTQHVIKDPLKMV